ncbi:hypothetical protein B0T16DRAFT_131455 [Cercophora newfieldiana]|uniref:Uncharacterized protein n=1 Tax=Cercophora newfieldiana TaxID=92897 RepID=A0AA39YB95_9PEZI|nr:hypothetical protein B0T16DRAFT_131455 [Cercophora newfieldiana]
MLGAWCCCLALACSSLGLSLLPVRPQIPSKVHGPQVRLSLIDKRLVRNQTTGGRLGLIRRGLMERRANRAPRSQGFSSGVGPRGSLGILPFALALLLRPANSVNDPPLRGQARRGEARQAESEASRERERETRRSAELMRSVGSFFCG